MISSATSPDYTGITETPGTLITREAESMAVSRYEIARRRAQGKRVLEVACGSGQGLGYVRRSAAWVVGGDITPGLLTTAQRHYQGLVPLVRFDAHALPFGDASFDMVQIHEALYYMSNHDRVLQECRRLLRPAGVLIISSINPQWADFNPSPHAVGYLDAEALKKLLTRHFADVELTGGFPVPRPTVASIIISILKRTAVRFQLIPRTMSGKTMLKRIFLGPLRPVPADLALASAPVDEPSAVRPQEWSRYRVIYAIAQA